MAILKRDQIIGAEDRKYVEVDVPEWNGSVRIRSLDAEQLLAQESVIDKRNKGDKKANPITNLLSMSIVDENGNPLFTEKDMHELARKSHIVLKRIMDAVNKLNGFEKAEKEKEEELGNSNGNPSDG